ncbi:beta-galactosidase [Persicobacter diffluens]|uniref:Glycoside hydrolase 35 catalytic domain-containing protein n=1 Tax=Persicobacter diffluens TaxID=981 RepID=A0AAN4W4B5_9BACT|nr:hypothetical protein PEDI_49500 [Persicobacter diffluens]
MKHFIPFILVFWASVGCRPSRNVQMENPPKAAYYYDLSNYKSQPLNYFEKMEGDSPSRGNIRVNNQYLELNGKAWLPTYGEFHFSRYEADRWEEEILKMKASGLTAISSYIFWNHHEEIAGQWDWSGNKDLRRFVQLCQKHDMLFFARIGPWCHGEARYGGHPDWLVAQCPGKILRSTHPLYLEPVKKLYAQIAKQLEGLFWEDGGPIFAIQFDNENWESGPGKGRELIDAEKAIALELGMKAPLYTITGWANAEFTQGEVIPAFGGYVDYFWSEAPEFYRCASFSFSEIRPDGDIGTDMGLQQRFDDKYLNNPFLTCETGTGMHTAFHRRPLITAKDNAAVALVELGNGCNGLGLFMFHGGTNPMGKNTRLHEALEDGYNDITVFSHDWQAAIGEFGQSRDTYHHYLPLLNFAKFFGADLAPMSPVIPEQLNANPFQSDLLQHAVRTDGNAGFIFFNNHIKHDTLYQFDQVQFSLDLPQETLEVPDRPITIPEGVYGCFPFNMPVGKHLLKYATLQPIASLEQGRHLVYTQISGIEPLLAFKSGTLSEVKGDASMDSDRQGYAFIRPSEKGIARIRLKDQEGNTITLSILSPSVAENTYFQDDQAVYSGAEQLTFTQDSVRVLSSREKEWLVQWSADQMDSVQVGFQTASWRLDTIRLQEGAHLQYPQRFVGDNVRLAMPVDSIFDLGTVIAVSPVCQKPSPDQVDTRITLDYEGATVRLFIREQFVHDNFWNGSSYEISLSHFSAEKEKLIYKILPLQKNDPIYINGQYLPDRKLNGNLLKVNQYKIVPIYKKSLALKRFNS